MPPCSTSAPSKAACRASTAFPSEKSGGGLLSKHFPLAQTSDWDTKGRFTSARHSPAARYAGLNHPGLVDPSRLHRLFASSNRITTLPAVLGHCRTLDTLSAKTSPITRVPADALAPTLRWLILPDHRIPALPDSLVGCIRLQKLMRAGNRLSRRPTGLAALQRLELLRLSANHLATAADAPPKELLALARLAWLAQASNLFSQRREQTSDNRRA